MNFLGKFNKKLVGLCFPVIGRFYYVISLVLLLAAWSMPEAYWSVRIILVWAWLFNSEIYFSGILERDYLPIQPENGVFYHFYCFLHNSIFLFLLLWLILTLLPWPSLQIKAQFGVVVAVACIFRAIGDRKYHPKKPEE